jgi:C1A family cysteine protease
VTAVKDQGACGSCYAFSTTAAIESAVLIRSRGAVVLNLSEQQIVSCTGPGSGYGNNGCGGGYMDTPFDYAIANGGLCSEAVFPYTSGQRGAVPNCLRCVPLLESRLRARVQVPSRNDAAFADRLMQQPLATAVYVNSDFQYYASGVYSGSCDGTPNHAILAVGFGVDKVSKVPFFRFKNQWGATWGEGGYVRLARGAAYGALGQCRIFTQAFYPVLA